VISEKVLSQVITHQFDSAHEALKTNNSVEISGFGKFLFNQKKAKTKIRKLTDIQISYNAMLEKDEITSNKADFIKSKISANSLTLNSLKPKIDEDK